MPDASSGLFGKNTLVKEGVLLLFLPSLGWASAYMFNYGRAQRLGIPMNLISISLPDVLHAVTSVIVPIVVIFLLVMVILQFVLVEPTKRILRRSETLVFVTFVVGLKISQAPFVWWLYGLGGLLFLYLVAIIIAMLFARNVQGLLRKLKHVTRQGSVDSPLTGSDAIFQAIGLANYGVLSAMGLMLALSYFAGVGSANNQKVYFERVGTNQVLVANGGGMMVFETFAGHQLTGKIEVIPTSDTGLTNLIPKDLGTLLEPRICETHSC